MPCSSCSTDASGYIVLPGLAVSDQKYEISVSNGSSYEAAATAPPYPISPSTDYYPTDVHASVVENDITEAVVTIGELSSLQIQFWDAYGTPLSSDVDFDMEGGRNMGIDASDSSIIYNYEESLTYSGGTSKKIYDLSPGSYKITVTEPGYRIWRVATGTGNEPDEIILPQGEYLLEKGIKILNEATPSYFVKVIDADTSFPLSGAEVSLVNTTEGFDEDATTDDYGYAYFPDSPSASLINGTSYDVEITLTGYDSESFSVTISDLTEDNISLNPST